MIDFDWFIASPSKWPHAKDSDPCCSVCSTKGRGFCSNCVYKDDPITVGEIVELRIKENKK